MGVGVGRFELGQFKKFEGGGSLKNFRTTILTYCRFYFTSLLTLHALI